MTPPPVPEWEKYLEKARGLAMIAYHYPPQDSKRGLENATDVIALALFESVKEAVEKEREDSALAARDFVEKNATYILHYHDKEGRTSEERVFHEARFQEIYQAIRNRGKGL